MSRSSDTARVVPGLRGLFTATLVPAILAATALVSLITWQALQATILRGFDEQLRAVATTTGVFIDGDDHRDILGPVPGPDGPLTPRDESTPLYRGYVEPMQAVMDRRGLTYLYTQVLGDDGAIHYVLDATRGDEHSPIGSPDQLPQSQIAGAEAVLRDGTVYISGVQRWDAWGLLKSAFAPIRTSSGEIVAMSGADIDIGVIEAKTRRALLQVLLAGSLALAVGVLLALALAHRMATVLGAVREGALRMASGDFDTQLTSPGTHELARLTGAFNEMSQALRHTLDDLRHQGAVTRRRRAAECLAERWSAVAALPSALPAGVALEQGRPRRGDRSSSGSTSGRTADAATPASEGAAAPADATLAGEPAGIAVSGWVTGADADCSVWALWWMAAPPGSTGGPGAGATVTSAGSGAAAPPVDAGHRRAVIAATLRSLCTRAVDVESWPPMLDALTEFGLTCVVRFDPETGTAHRFAPSVDASAAADADADPDDERWAVALADPPQAILTLPAPRRWIEVALPRGVS